MGKMVLISQWRLNIPNMEHGVKNNARVPIRRSKSVRFFQAKSP